MEKPKVTRITYSTLSENARFLEKVKELPENDITSEALQLRLAQIMTPWMNEGFFAKTVVLVEGIKDRALILEEALSQGFDFESMGICVIPCSGKCSLPEIISIYKFLEIPAFVIWDSDEGKAEGIIHNKRILRCFGIEPENYPCLITDDFCCTKTNLEATFRNEVGDSHFQRISSKYCNINSLGKPTYSMENPYSVQKIIELLKAEKYESETLKGIIERILKKHSSI